MNKYQARCKLIAGEKITHAHFLWDQFLEVVGRVVFTEGGYPIKGAPYDPFGFGAPAGATPLEA